MHQGNSAAEWRSSWPVVLAGALGVSTCVIHLYTLGLFVAPVELEFGWKRATIASGLTVLSAVGVLAAPVAGRLADRFGPRRVGLAGLLLYTAAFAAMGTVQGLASWWLTWGLLGVGWAFTAPPVWTAAIAARFDRGRGLALAVTLCGGGVTLVFGPLLARWLIDMIGWRASHGALAALWLLVAAPVVFLFFRDPPQEGVHLRASAPPLRQSGCFTSNFLQILAAGFLANGIIVTMTVHFVPILTAGGRDRPTAAAIASLIGIAAIAGRLGTGLLLDRCPVARVSGLAFLLPAVAAVLMILAPASLALAVAAALVLGLAFGAEFDIVAYLVSRRFALASFGTLFGIITGCLTLASGMGPLLAGEVFDLTGSYTPFLAGIVAAAGCASVLIVLGSTDRHPLARLDPLLAKD